MPRTSAPRASQEEKDQRLATGCPDASFGLRVDVVVIRLEEHSLALADDHPRVAHVAADHRSCLTCVYSTRISTTPLKFQPLKTSTGPDLRVYESHGGCGASKEDPRRAFQTSPDHSAKPPRRRPSCLTPTHLLGQGRVARRRRIGPH